MNGKFLYLFATIATLAGVGCGILLSKVKARDTTIVTLEKAKTALEESKEQLTKDLSTAKSVLAKTEESLTKTEESLTKTQNTLTELERDHYKKIAEHARVMELAHDEITAKDEKISALNAELSTAQNKHRDYDSQIEVLKSQVADKDRAINDIGRRLESAEEDRDYLRNEREKLLAEKAELEKQFQDILVLRQKVQNLQVELMASKKLEWLRRGFYGGARKKGGSQLMSMSKKNDRKTVSPNADLNVEVRRDGTVKIVPIETNSPPNVATP